jgi:Uncharacterized protein conserved in bacteria (DUF2188)
VLPQRYHGHAAALHVAEALLGEAHRIPDTRLRLLLPREENSTSLSISARTNLRRKKVKRIDVVKKGDDWVAESEGKTVAQAPVKTDAVQATAEVAKASSESVTVKIHKENGRIQEERTYPRSADPRSSKG